jgi:hypothetical protein
VPGISERSSRDNGHVFFRKAQPDPAFARTDQGSGSLDDYKFDLVPSSSRTRIRLAGSDPHQDLLASILDVEEVETAIGRRTLEEERVDAPMPVRLFAAGRIVGPVGQVPRGLEGVVSEAISRLEMAGRKTRIPVDVVRTKQGLRVDLLMGRTR